MTFKTLAVENNLSLQVIKKNSTFSEQDYTFDLSEQGRTTCGLQYKLMRPCTCNLKYLVAVAVHLLKTLCLLYEDTS